jgi:hypothetical protein
VAEGFGSVVLDPDTSPGHTLCGASNSPADDGYRREPPDGKTFRADGKNRYC